ncbi:cytochrome ubiquinol oxidase subunit I [Reyranella soli]|uniref:cytochrome ubiquinol oxidase subunit I n=1 Tax=Reyranella soli TaxID=1230389 RepID=UPI001C3FAC1A|nr:cytochrome ubiquinol oxidase subunit I [Reyranella soli]
MELDPVILSRLQFAWLIGWHILMPAFTVGMASYIVILEGFHPRLEAASISAFRCSGSGFSRSLLGSAWCQA